jgi:nicotinamide-nucleotide amidase
MRIEIVAVGTELLLGQIADTNSAWLGDRLASAGVTSHFHQAVGDNHERITLAFRTAWPGATGSSSAAASGRPRTTSPARPSPRSWGSSSSATRRSSTSSPGSSVPGPHHVGQQRPPGRRAGGGHHHPAGDGHRARAHLPAGPQGDLRRARCALRDGRDVRPGHPARPAGPHGRGRRGERHRQPGGADLGRQRVRAGRVPAGADRGAPIPTVCRRARSPWPSWRRASRGSRCGSRRGPPRWPKAPPCSTSRRRPCEAIEADLGDIVFGVDDESMEVAVANQLIARGSRSGVAESLTGGLIASGWSTCPARRPGSGAAWWPTTSR